MRPQQHVVVMARRPEWGRVKTRLAADLGDNAALALYRRLLCSTLRCLARDERWITVIAATPPDAARGREPWTRGLPAIAQVGGGLGERMQAAFDAMPPGPVVMVGSDIPDLRSRHVARAFRALKHHDAVFGPALDGGYWLIGVSEKLRQRPLFSEVCWSTADALNDTLQGLPPWAKVAMVDRLGDIDTSDDLERWRRRASSRR
ncbi:MAG: hypothetical protein CMM46_06735 [Rhodospirillaceae bacterium]|nr:hypothetical protein [Rhodospirillaceae bacterium]|tara:strand:- start:9142 stop:9753 length:612 start_codon:yes stop_codon:yes gene_type:complete